MLQGFSSAPVHLNLDDLMLKRAVGPGVAALPTRGQEPSSSAAELASAQAVEAIAGSDDPLLSTGDGSQTAAAMVSGEIGADADTAVLDREEAEDADHGEEAGARTSGPVSTAGPAAQKEKAGRAAGGRGISATGPQHGRTQVGLAKKYGPGFVWGQLNGWYKQTVFDPTASLSAERRGTISMPDIESCYGGSRSRYTVKVRFAGRLTSPLCFAS